MGISTVGAEQAEGIANAERLRENIRGMFGYQPEGQYVRADERGWVINDE